MQFLEKNEHKKNIGISAVLRQLYSYRETKILATLTALSLLFYLTTDSFIYPINLLNIMRQMSEICIMAVGMTMLIIVRQIDLSIGSIFGLSAVIMSFLARDYNISLWIALPIAISMGAASGFLSGWLTTRLGIPSFIVTLGMMGILRGAALVIASGFLISQLPETNFTYVFAGQLFDLIPMQVIWMLAITIIGIVFLNKYVFGYYLYATGRDEMAARLSGINTDNITIYAFMITGALAAFSGAIMLAHVGSSTPFAGRGIELDVIATVVIGGTALSGGIGTIQGTFFGAALITALRNGLVLLGVSSYHQAMVIGFIIIIAVVIDTWSNRLIKRIE